MAFSWKAAGISYLKYTQICARAVRNALKEEQRLIAQRRDEQGIKFAKWESGKQGEL
ncbi:13488_t:CDS:2, partial [Funneliformis geosporum]